MHGKNKLLLTHQNNSFYRSFECSFLGSINTLISPTKIQTIPYADPIESNAGFDVHEKPQKDSMYCIAVDVARGGQNDYSAFTVIDITTVPYRLVAKYKDNEIKPLLFPEIIFNIATAYNEAYLLIEINDIGAQIADALHYDLEYENIIMSQMRGRAGQVIGSGFGEGKSDLGIRTTKAVKKVGCF